MPCSQISERNLEITLMNVNHMDRTIEQNYRRVLERIEKKALQVGRGAEKIQMIVVTKGHPLESIEQVISAGARILGENYLEEAVPKIRATTDQTDIEWHMIGHIQSRKARGVSENFTLIHSVDSLKLARRLDRFAQQGGRILPILLECNVSGEESKFGWAAWQEDRWSDLLDGVKQVLDLPNLQVRGLMTMPPYSEAPEHSRPHFIRLRELQALFADHYPETDWGELSMGMSMDFEIAIEEGATMLRIGTEIMGARAPKSGST